MRTILHKASTIAGGILWLAFIGLMMVVGGMLDGNVAMAQLMPYAIAMISVAVGCAVCSLINKETE